MIFEVSKREIQQQITNSLPNKWECTMKAIGDRDSIDNYFCHCGDWPPVVSDKKIETLTWQDQPTKDGYYWFLDDTNDLKIVEVYWSDNKILGAQVSFHGNDDDSDLINITGKWYGPITPPEED